MKLPNNLKLIRKKWKVNQEEFANLFDISRGAVATYEGGVNEPKLKLLLKLVELSGIGIYEMCMTDLNEEDIPNNPYSSLPEIPKPKTPIQLDPSYDYESRIADLEKRVDALQRSKK